MNNLNALRDEVYAINKANGWHEEGRTFGELIALVHSEVSEALEDFRNGKAVNEVWYEYKDFTGCVVTSSKNKLLKSEFYKSLMLGDDDLIIGKPCGIPSELADVVIRILDICGLYEWDIEAAHQFSIGDRSLKGKSFLEILSEIHSDLSAAYDCEDIDFEGLNALDSAVQIVEFICHEHDIDLKSIIRQKLEYNKTRGYKHGGKVI